MKSEEEILAKIAENEKFAEENVDDAGIFDFEGWVDALKWVLNLDEPGRNLMENKEKNETEKREVIEPIDEFNNKMTNSSLNVKKMEVVESEDLLKDMLGKEVIFWIDSNSLFLRMKVLHYSFVSLSPAEKIDTVMFTDSQNTSFGVPLRHGFGFKFVNESEHYWVDGMTIDEAAVITYAKVK